MRVFGRASVYLLRANSRIRCEQQRVCDKIAGHEENRGEHHCADDHVNVLCQNCVHQQGADAGPAQHNFQSKDAMSIPAIE